MIIRQLLYAFCLTASFIFFLLYPPWISWYIFVLLLILIPIDLIVSLPGMMSKSVRLSVPPVLEMNTDAVFSVITIHKKSYPVRCLIVKFQAAGDGFSAVCRIKCSGEANDKREVTIDTSCSGVTVFEIKRIWAVSMIGLFALPATVKARESVLILPPPVKPISSMALQHGIRLKPKPGGGFSEEHDMRDYRPGDPVRSIHWKISAKFDSLIIREPLVLPPHSRLIHVIKWRNAAERDLILGRLRWVSNYLLSRRMAYYVKFDKDDKITEIEQDSDLHEFLRSALDSKSAKTRPALNVPARFSWVFRIDAASSGVKSVTSFGNQKREGN